MPIGWIGLATASGVASGRDPPGVRGLTGERSQQVAERHFKRRFAPFASDFATGTFGRSALPRGETASPTMRGSARRLAHPAPAFSCTATPASRLRIWSISTGAPIASYPQRSSIGLTMSPTAPAGVSRGRKRRWLGIAAMRKVPTPRQKRPGLDSGSRRRRRAVGLLDAQPLRSGGKALRTRHRVNPDMSTCTCTSTMIALQHLVLQKEIAMLRYSAISCAGVAALLATLSLVGYVASGRADDEGVQREVSVRSSGGSCRSNDMARFPQEPTAAPLLPQTPWQRCFRERYRRNTAMSPRLAKRACTPASINTTPTKPAIAMAAFAGPRRAGATTSNATSAEGLIEANRAPIFCVEASTVTVAVTSFGGPTARI